MQKRYFFYRKNRGRCEGSLFYLTNFHLSDICVSAKNATDPPTFTYKSVEHYFQFCKLLYLKQYQLADQVKNASSADKAKKLAWTYKMTLDEQKGWDFRTKHRVMFDGLKHKFDQHPRLAKKLMETHPAILIEDSGSDYWGIGKPEEKGFNLMGKMLMIIRDALLSKEIKNLDILTDIFMDRVSSTY